MEGGRGTNDRSSRSAKDERPVVGQSLDLVRPEVVLVREDRVLRRLGRSDQSRVRMQVEFVRHRRRDGFAVCRERKQTGCQLLGFRRKDTRKGTYSTTVPVQCESTRAKSVYIESGKESKWVRTEGCPFGRACDCWWTLQIIACGVSCSR